MTATYEVGERIGSGRLGSDVYRGAHRALGHPVAVRMLRADAHPNWTAVRERFLREARAQQVAHPSIIQVRDFGEEPGLVYLVTDFIEGPSLRDVLDQGALPWTRLRAAAGRSCWTPCGSCTAAQALHLRDAARTSCGSGRGAGPDDDGERLMISTAGIWRAQDLLATLHERTLRGMALEDIELRYIAPELLTGGAVDERSDVFTLGVLAYEMATARVPFDGASLPELLGRMLAGAAADPRSSTPGLPEPFVTAVLRALRPSPADRYPSVRELAHGLHGHKH